MYFLFSKPHFCRGRGNLFKSDFRSNPGHYKDQNFKKAVYQKSDIVTSRTSKLSSSDGLNEDIMTKHLLKLNEIEDQFRELTNKLKK